MCCVALVLTVSVWQFRIFTRHLAENATRSAIEAYLVSLQVYKGDCGAFPDQKQGLQALLTDPGAQGWKGPYVRCELPSDSWGNMFQYTIENGMPRLRSAGADRRVGTTDDITN